MSNEDILMSLKNGNVPSKGVRNLCVGRDNELEEFERLLEKVDEEDKAYTKFLKGEFGAGKSFFLKVIEDMSYKNGFAVSWITVSNNVPFNKIEIIYRNVAKNLRVKTGTSLEHIIDRWYTQHYNMASQDTDDEYEKLALLKERIHDELEETRQYSTAFATVIENYVKLRSEDDAEGASSAISWLRGDENMPFSIKKKFGIKSEINKTNALGFLEALSAFIKSIGYSGLVILVDEVEVIRKLNTQNMRDTAYDYIRLIYDNCSIDQFQSTLFVFAGTRELFEDSKRGIPSYTALEERIKKAYETDLVDVRTPVFVLKGFDKNDIIELSTILLNMHSDAYNWDATTKINPIIETIAENHVSNASLTAGRVNARDFIRKFITLLDTVEQNQEYFDSPENILEEFNGNINPINNEEYDEFDDDW